MNTRLVVCTPTRVQGLVDIRCPLCRGKTTLDYGQVIEYLRTHGSSRQLCGRCNGEYKIVGHTMQGDVIAQVD